MKTLTKWKSSKLRLILRIPYVSWIYRLFNSLHLFCILSVTVNETLFRHRRLSLWPVVVKLSHCWMLLKLKKKVWNRNSKSAFDPLKKRKTQSIFFSWLCFIICCIFLFSYCIPMTPYSLVIYWIYNYVFAVFIIYWLSFFFVVSWEQET